MTSAPELSLLCSCYQILALLPHHLAGISTADSLGPRVPNTGLSPGQATADICGGTWPLGVAEPEAPISPSASLSEMFPKP